MTDPPEIVPIACSPVSREKEIVMGEELGHVLRYGACRVALLLPLWAPVGQIGAAESEEELLRRGRELYQSGQYNQAIECFSSAIEVNPSDARYYDGRGLAYLHKPDADKATKDIEQALRLDSRLASAYLHRGYIHLHRKNFDQAIADFTRAIDIDRDGVVAYAGLCTRSFAKYEITEPEEYHKRPDRGDPPGMADVLRAIKLRPEAPDAYMFRGGLFNVYLEDSSRAKEDYDKAIAINPRRMDALGRRAMLHYQLGEGEEKVLADLNAAIALERKYAPPYMALDFDAELAKVLTNRGVLSTAEQAIRDYKEALRLSPNDVVARLNLGNWHAKKKEFDQAIQEYGRIIEIDPKSSSAYRARGCVLADQGKLDDALADFLETTRLEPQNAESHNDLGTVLDAKQQPHRAIEAFSRAISLDPTEFKSYLNRGANYLDLEQYDKAIADFSAAIGLVPEYYECRVNRGIAYTRIGEWEKAIADFSKDIELRPFSSDAYARRAAAYERSGQLDKAKADYAKAESNSGPLEEFLQAIHLLERSE